MMGISGYTIVWRYDLCIKVHNGFQEYVPHTFTLPAWTVESGWLDAFVVFTPNYVITINVAAEIKTR